MRETVRITSKLRNTQLSGRTLINGTEWVLLDDFFLITKAEHDKKDSPHYGKKIQDIDFTSAVQFKEIEYDTDDPEIIPLDKDNPRPHFESKLTAELNRRKRISITEFWSRHDQVEHKTDFKNNFRPKLPPIAEIEIISQQGRNYHLADRKKVEIFNAVEAMSWQEQYDLALYYAPWLFGKRRSEVLHGLIGLIGKGGAMWQGTNADDFLVNYKQHPAVVMKIYISKAQSLGLLTLGVGGLYLNGAQFVGRDIDDAVVYFSKDTQAYTNVIQPEVNRLSQLPEDDLGEMVIETLSPSKFEKGKTTAEKTAEYEADLRRLRAEYEAMGGNPNIMGYNKLKEEVPKLRAKLDKEAKSDALPTAKLAQAIAPEDTHDIVALKKEAKEVGVLGWQGYKDPNLLRDKIKEAKAKVAV